MGAAVGTVGWRREAQKRRATRAARRLLSAYFCSTPSTATIRKSAYFMPTSFSMSRHSPSFKPWSAAGSTAGPVGAGPQCSSYFCSTPSTLISRASGACLSIHSLPPPL